MVRVRHSIVGQPKEYKKEEIVGQPKEYKKEEIVGQPKEYKKEEIVNISSAECLHQNLFCAKYDRGPHINIMLTGT